MSETRPPNRLEKLRIVEGFLRHQLDQVERWIAEEERRAAERERGQVARPAPADWLLERGLNRDALPVAVHVGGCHMAGKRVKGIPRQEALRWLADGVEACTHCRPDAELGFLEG